MKFSIFGITGNTGGAAAEALLAQGHGVRALVRDPAKAAAWAARGVELVPGVITDAAAVASALEGVDGAYVLVPPQWGVADTFAANQPVIDALLAGLAAQPVARVVMLSSVGVHLAAGTGPIRGLRPLEAGLSEHPGVTFLRANYFQENLGSGLGPAAQDGVLPVFIGANTPVHMVATVDIGAEAARQLLIAPKAAARVVNLAGPGPVTFAEVANILSELLGRAVAPLELPTAALVQTLTGMGAGHLATLYGEMTDTMATGGLDYEPGAPITRGPTPVRATLARMLGR